MFIRDDDHDRAATLRAVRLHARRAVRRMLTRGPVSVADAESLGPVELEPPGLGEVTASVREGYTRGGSYIAALLKLELDEVVVCIGHESSGFPVFRLH